MEALCYESAFVCLREYLTWKSISSKSKSPVDYLSGRRAKRQVPSWSIDMRRDLMGESVKARLLANKLTKVILYALQPAFPFSKKFFDTFLEALCCGSAFVCLWKLMEQKSCIANQTARCGCLSGLQSCAIKLRVFPKREKLVLRT